MSILIFPSLDQCFLRNSASRSGADISSVGNKLEKKTLLHSLPLFLSTSLYYNSYCPEICTESIQNSSALPWILGNSGHYIFLTTIHLGRTLQVVKEFLSFSVPVTHKSRVASLMTDLPWVCVYSVFPLLGEVRLGKSYWTSYSVHFLVIECLWTHHMMCDELCPAYCHLPPKESCRSFLDQ